MNPMSAFPLSEVGSRLFNHLDDWHRVHLKYSTLVDGEKTLKYQRDLQHDTGYAIEKEPANQKMAIHESHKIQNNEWH